MARKSAGGNYDEQAVYVISVAASLAGVHPQTLRFYERKRLIEPRRTSGNTRRYSERDVSILREIQHLTQEEGVNLAGVKIIMELEHRLETLRSQVEQAHRRVAALEADLRNQRVRTQREALVRLSDVRDIFESR
jgi:MerR family transcriptional regulator, heat shock protein HspR